MGTVQRPRKQLVRKTITVPANLQTYCDEFNAGLFFESHEHLEEVWQQERGPVRDFYKGLIQLAAAYVHLGRGNLKGGERLCRTGLQYLEPYRGHGRFRVRCPRSPREGHGGARGGREGHGGRKRRVRPLAPPGDALRPRSSARRGPPLARLGL